LIEPAAPPEAVITAPPVPQEIPETLTDAVAPAPEKDAYLKADLPERQQKRPAAMVIAGAAGVGCVGWMLSMMLITFILNTLQVDTANWVYAISILGFLAAFSWGRNALNPSRKKETLPVPETVPVVVNHDEVRLLLKIGEVHTLFAGDLTLTVDRIQYDAEDQPESADFRLQAPGFDRQKFKKINPGSRLKYEADHLYEMVLAKCAAPENSLAMRIRRTQ
jgi:hypothetical protein